MKGRLPKPTVIRQMEGNLGKRPYNLLEPKPRACEPPMPKGLCAGARKHWREMVEMLMVARVLTEADGRMLGLIAQNLAECETLNKQIKKTGMLIKNPTTGAIHTNPLVVIEMQKRRDAIAGLKEFGMTPSSRTRIQTVGEPAMDDLESALCG